jgi:hypothetical protein
VKYYFNANSEKENSGPRFFKELDLPKMKGNFTPYRSDKRASFQPLDVQQHGKSTPRHWETRGPSVNTTEWNATPSAVGTATSQAKEPVEVSV